MVDCSPLITDCWSQNGQRKNIVIVWLVLSNPGFRPVSRGTFRMVSVQLTLSSECVSGCKRVIAQRTRLTLLAMQTVAQNNVSAKFLQSTSTVM